MGCSALDQQASRSSPAAGAITLHAEDGWVGVTCGGTRFAAGRSVLAGTRVPEIDSQAPLDGQKNER